MTGSDVQSLIRLSLTDPDQAARALVGLRLPAQARWLAVALAAVLTVTLAQLTILAPGAELSPMGRVLHHPLTGFVFQAGSILLIALAMTHVGRWFGGRGGFGDALVLTAWIEFMMVLVGAVQLVLALTVPFLAFFALLAAIVLFMTLLVRFTAVLHGFTNRWLVLAGIVGTFVAASFALAILASLAGIAPESIL